MDLKKTGEFIAEQRKNKKLTQVQLAEKLSVSGKTISKWECGNGFPDTTLMLPLCKELEITANELLSAKKLNDKEYKEKAEEQILLLKTEQERNAKFLLTIERGLGSICTILILGLIFIASFITMHNWLRITLILASVTTLILICLFLIKIEQNAGYYKCKKCGHKYVPSYNAVLWAPHYGTTRFMKCPKCKKYSFQKKTITKD